MPGGVGAAVAAIGGRALPVDLPLQQLQHSLHNGLLGGGLLAAFRFGLATVSLDLATFLAKIANQFGEHILRRIRALVRLRYGCRHLLLRRIRALVRLRYGRRRLSLRFNRLLLRFGQLLSRFNHQLVRFLAPLGQFFAGVIRILARFGQPFLGVLARFLFPGSAYRASYTCRSLL